MPQKGIARGFSWYGVDGVDRVVEAHFSDSTEPDRYNTVVTSRMFDLAGAEVSRKDSESRIRTSLLDFAAQQLANERLRTHTGESPVDLEALRIQVNEERSRLDEVELIEGTFTLDGDPTPSRLFDVGDRRFLATRAKNTLVMVAGSPGFVESAFKTTTQSIY